MKLERTNDGVAIVCTTKEEVALMAVVMGRISFGLADEAGVDSDVISQIYVELDKISPWQKINYDVDSIIAKEKY